MTKYVPTTEDTSGETLIPVRFCTEKNSSGVGLMTKIYGRPWCVGLLRTGDDGKIELELFGGLPSNIFGYTPGTTRIRVV